MREEYDDYDYDEEYEKRKRRAAAARKKKKKKKKRIVLFVIEIAVLAVLVIGVFVFASVNSGLRKLGTGVTSDTSSDNPDLDTDNVQISEEVAVDKVMSGYTNILLVGLDARDYDDPDYCNSDTMIICSINNDNGEIRLVSILRDTYLNVDPDGWQFEKANSAYCYGSVTQCLSMINKNLDMNITQYVTVDFSALATLVDDIGGVDIELSEQEIVHLNNYCKETSEVTGMSYEDLPEVAGTYTLNGVQAVSYARIRYTAGQDMKRAQRQRLLVNKIIEKARSSGITGVTAIINDVFPLCKTNISNAMLIKMATQMIGYYAIVDTNNFPFQFLENSQYVNEEFMVPVTLEKNVQQLHEFLFNETDYDPSQTVKDYSLEIEQTSGYTMDDYDHAVEASTIPLAGSEADTVR